MTDSCPNCVHRGVEPLDERRDGDQITHDYHCPACGHGWFTSRYLPAYSEIHNRPAVTTCPTPSKWRYATREAAVKAANRQRLSVGKQLNPHDCRCGWFHLTSLAPAENYRGQEAS